MARCEVCGNNYDKSFRLTESTGEEHVFDSFECAIQSVAPTCSRCGIRIIGHGLEAEGEFFCCANCARATGEDDLQDRA